MLQRPWDEVCAAGGVDSRDGGREGAREAELDMCIRKGRDSGRNGCAAAEDVVWYVVEPEGLQSTKSPRTFYNSAEELRIRRLHVRAPVCATSEGLDAE